MLLPRPTKPSRPLRRRKDRKVLTRKGAKTQRMLGRTVQAYLYPAPQNLRALCVLRAFACFAPLDMAVVCYGRFRLTVVSAATRPAAPSPARSTNRSTRCRSSARTATCRRSYWLIQPRVLVPRPNSSSCPITTFCACWSAKGFRSHRWALRRAMADGTRPITARFGNASPSTCTCFAPPPPVSGWRRCWLSCSGSRNGSPPLAPNASTIRSRPG